MSNFAVQNIFHRLGYLDLCIRLSERSNLTIPIHKDQSLSKQLLNRNHFIELPKLISILGNYPIVLFSKDLMKFCELFQDDSKAFLESNSEILNKIGYHFLDVGTVERFDPPAGYLYNYLRANKEANVVLHRNFSQAIGITNFDLAVLKIKETIERFY